MKKNGPSPGQLDEFRDRVEKEKALSRMDFYNHLADVAGMSCKTVRNYFAAPVSGIFRECPFSLWKLWHLSIFNEEPADGKRK